MVLDSIKWGIVSNLMYTSRRFYLNLSFPCLNSGETRSQRAGGLPPASCLGVSWRCILKPYSKCILKPYNNACNLKQLLWIEFCKQFDTHFPHWFSSYVFFWLFLPSPRWNKASPCPPATFSSSIREKLAACLRAQIQLPRTQKWMGCRDATWTWSCLLEHLSEIDWDFPSKWYRFICVTRSLDTWQPY
jgi:hypothetical protein